MLSEPDLAAPHREIVRHLVTVCLPPCRVLIFGSRARGGARRFSDLDLALDAGEPLPLSALERLRDALSLSDLPMAVDVIDLHTVAPGFRQHIADDLLPL